MDDIKNKIKRMPSIKYFFLADLKNLIKSFAINLNQPIAKRLPGVGWLFIPRPAVAPSVRLGHG